MSLGVVVVLLCCIDTSLSIKEKKCECKRKFGRSFAVRVEFTVSDDLKESTRSGSFPGDRQQLTAQLPQLLSQDVVFTGGRAAGRSAVAAHAHERRKESVRSTFI